MFPLSQQEMLPLSFDVAIAGVRQSATVLEDRSDYDSMKYLVRFQDCTEAVFIEGDGPDLFTTQPGLQHYADALLPDLFTMQLIEPGSFYYILPYELGGKTINVWLIEHEPDQGDLESIGVHYHQRCRIEIYKDGSETYQWRRIGQPLLTPEEDAMAEDLLATFKSIHAGIQLQ